LGIHSSYPINMGIGAWISIPVKSRIIALMRAPFDGSNEMDIVLIGIYVKR